MRLVALAAGLLFALTGLASAQTFDTPEDLIDAFYAPYFGGDEIAPDTDFRSAALNAIYENDAKITPQGEMGALSFDPYVDGQDYDLADFTIHDAVINGGDFATVEVTFLNLGEPRSLTYELVLENGGWRIDDVVSNNPENSYRLSEIFAENAAYYQ